MCGLVALTTSVGTVPCGSVMTCAGSLGHVKVTTGFRRYRGNQVATDTVVLTRAFANIDSSTRV